MSSARYAPMLAAPADTLPVGADWAFEPKWDGYRAIADVERDVAFLRSRNGNDLTARFPGVAEAVADAVRSKSALLDGEICALDAEGRSAFGLLQQGRGLLVYVAFDVLEHDGESLLDRTYLERQGVLAELLDPSVTGVLRSPSFDDGAALESAAREHGLEGVVAKRKGSRYQPGRRSTDWRKLKLRQRQEFAVVGYARGKGGRSGRIGSLLLGVNEGGVLRYVGKVGSGIGDAELGLLEQLLLPLRLDDAPFADGAVLARSARGSVVWVEPRLVAEIEFAEWTTGGQLRAPVYLGLREDRQVRDVIREQVAVPPEIRRGNRLLRFSNLDKPFWPDESISKGDLIAYYRDVAPALVPHLRDRPFTMKRYPDGWSGKHFFQKDAPSHMPVWIRRAPFPASTRDSEERTIDYALVNDDLALLWMINMGCIDLNAWAARADRPDRPDWVLFDLDPSDDVGFAEVIEVALLVRQTLDLLGLESFPKTSGSRGMHVLVPIARRHSYDQTRSFASVVGAALARTHPGLVTTEWVKRKRRGVLVDANQNGPGKTTACVYSVRPRAGAPVSTPLAWDEVRQGLDPAVFTMDEVRRRLARHGDLFSPVLQMGQSLRAALKLLG